MPGLTWRDSGSQESSWTAGFGGNKDKVGENQTLEYLDLGTRKSGERHTLPFFHFLNFSHPYSCFGLLGVPWSRKDLVSPGS